MAAVPSAVLLVRHAMPEVDPSVDGTLWPLTDEGRAASRALGRRLAPMLADGVVIAGDERKMVETADALVGEIPTASTRTEPRVGEAYRPWVGDGDYAEIARSMGCNGVKIENPADIGPALKMALESRKPTVLDVIIAIDQSFMAAITPPLLTGSVY